MLEGLVQNDHPLTVGMILRRMRTVNGDSEVVTLRAPGQIDRATYREVGDRCDLLADALSKLGVGEGDRVGTFMWNNQEHLEAYYAIPAMGAVLHTLNLRLFPEQLVYIVNHAKDKVIIVNDSVIPLLAPHTDKFETVEKYIVVGDGDASALPADKVIKYEDLLASAEPGFQYPDIDDRSASGLCYTSGTTGDPKGVLYSNRSTFLHAIASGMTDSLGVSGNDIVLPVVPMFHAQAWGLAYAAPLVGANLVMPDKFLQGEPLAKLIEGEKVTVAGAVPTLWMDLLRYADENKPDLSSLRCVPCGGAAVPKSLMEAFQERHGVLIVQAWGMTETSPLGSVARPPRGVSDEEAWSYRTTAGRIAPGVEARITDDEGGEVAWDGESTGELEVRGPWIASAYYETDAPEKFHDGWLRTGDVAAINPQGYIRITDRAKDVIKSGGEWISSVDLENELMSHPAVREAAVIAKPDERYTERPLACVVLDEGKEVQAGELASFLLDRVAKWWIPDEYAFIEEVPKTSVGKFDKKVLRARLEDGELTDRQTVEKIGA
ncbi:long-chain-fatty-acid--CoA ligase [Conexibacter sp. W3-3-2]|uniref:long-chain fatty acid--CoA ligase n=1 Tax=Conexibacter sp. W3-3-2 TaxID=2675227 RepID=UPI0012B6D31B|nr:long-chain fatty acid--CoA ligase [Conexibacter sp. W3-3-2]MTD45940.1 long-chain-fatty-acid--CoA ligase [Conexibacter sp. W3-3-2]